MREFPAIQSQSKSQSQKNTEPLQLPRLANTGPNGNKEAMSVLVMTILAKDKAGLVEAVASTISENGGNWLESRMSRLGGYFAGILQIEVESERKKALIEQLSALEKIGIHVQAHETTELDVTDPGKLVSLDLVGHDRPGIVSQITGALARHGVNVEELETDCVSAPMSGEPLFQAKAKLRLPEGCDIPALRKELERLASNLMVDFILEAR